MNAPKNATSFEATSEVAYTTGIGQDANGAIITNHNKGPYTVVKDYAFGTDDFTISSWFNVPDDAEVSTGSGTYLFGIDHPDTKTKFAVSLKSGELRFRLEGVTKFISVTYERGSWYNLTLCRKGTNMKIYFDGSLVGTYTVSEGCDLGTSDIAFGAYYGVSYAYQDANMYYDEIKIYKEALSEETIIAAANRDLGSTVLTYTDQSTMITDSDLFYTNDLTTSGADPGCIYITEGAHAGWFFVYFSFNNSTQVKCMKSKDLVTWVTADSAENRCFTPDTDSWGVSELWAPEVIYDKTDGKYYMFYSATNRDSDHVTGYKYLGLAVSDSPVGPFRQYVGTNSDGAAIGIGDPIFDGEKLPDAYYKEGGTGFIDASPFVDPITGDKYLYMARNRDNHDSNIVCVVKMKDWATPDYSTYTELTTVNKITYNGSTETERGEGVINEAPQMLYHEGVYYLTMSINGTAESEYSVIQATGTSPMGPFTKVQQSDGGLVLGIELQDGYKWNHISCCGSHSFVYAGEELFVLYHEHTDPTDIGGGRIRSLALDRVTWAENAEGQTVLKAIGPTRSVQPKPAVYSGYTNLATTATVTATNTATGSDAGYLNDGLVRFHYSDCVEQFEGSGDVTVTMTFDDPVTARALLLYNSWNYADAFEKVKSVEFKYCKMVDGIAWTGTARISELDYDLTSYSYTNESGNTVMVPGAPMVLEFDDMDIIEVSIVIACPEGKDIVAVSEIMLLGKATMDETDVIGGPDVYINYNNGTLNYTAFDRGVTVGAYQLSASQGSDTTFVEYDGTVEYTTGIDEDTNGAIITNHNKGPYTVIKDYDFGTDDFTISVWFKVPDGAAMSAAGSYIFGISNPDASVGFSACIKYDSGQKAYQLRFRNAGKNAPFYTITDFARDTWYHLTLCRDGVNMKWYKDNTLITTQTATEVIDYGTADLAFGAYTGWSSQYKDANMYFDDILVYGKALTGDEISYAAQMMERRADWRTKGSNGKTTLFIGDSFFSYGFWSDFYETYNGKDVLRAGISSTTTEDWDIFVDTYLAYTSPKNIVMHLGTNDIHVDSNDQETVIQALQTLFTRMHGLENLKDTRIYYFGIPYKKSTAYSDESYKATVDGVNEAMKAWCKEREWITYIDSLTGGKIADDQFRDNTHLTLEAYSLIVNALAETNIDIEDIEERKEIDIYLIAGQSNAAGYTVYDSDKLQAMDERYVNGFSNIYYTGAVAAVRDIDSTLREFSIQNVKAGLGIYENRIGPELGLAEELSSVYNEETGAYAGFIKYAVGGSSLLTDSGKETWASPSYKAGLTLEADDTGTGALYESFLKEVENGLEAYREAGFYPVIKGIYWMQGEADRYNVSEYIKAFPALMSDMRNDLTERTGQNLKKMPVIVGEISRTFDGWTGTTWNANNEFIAMQRLLPSLVSYCTVVESSVFDITACDPEDTANTTGIILGSDSYHWNQADQIAIGQLVGQALKEPGLTEREQGDINGNGVAENSDLSMMRQMLLREYRDTSMVVSPEVYVSFDDGKVANSGADEMITAELCQFDQNSSPTTFVSADGASYTADRIGNADGAIVTNHYSGPYTVIRDHAFGADDFTVSVWFQVPEAAKLSSGSGSYLFGNDEPDGTEGFSFTLKEGILRFRLRSVTRFLSFSCSRDTWHNLTFCRENTVVKVYADGSLLYTDRVAENQDFGRRDLAFGAYVGLQGAYMNAQMHFDDVQVYDTALTSEEIKALVGSSALIPVIYDVNGDMEWNIKDLVALKKLVGSSSDIFDAETSAVWVNFDDGTVENRGTKSSVTAGAYVLDAVKNSTSFIATSDVTYGIGLDGSEGSAIVTNNKSGAYTVLDGLELGTGDFAVSAWFMVPEGQTLSTGNSSYLFGTSRVDNTAEGFRVTMRKDTSGYRLSFRSAGNAQELYTLTDFEYGQWHNVAVARIGTALYLYFDGELRLIQLVTEDFDMGDRVLAFGAYVGETWSYNDKNILFDDIRVYDGTVDASAVKEIAR